MGRGAAAGLMGEARGPSLVEPQHDSERHQDGIQQQHGHPHEQRKHQVPTLKADLFKVDHQILNVGVANRGTRYQTQTIKEGSIKYQNKWRRRRACRGTRAQTSSC